MLRLAPPFLVHLVSIVPQRKPAAFTAKTLLVRCARMASLRPPVAVICPACYGTNRSTAQRSQPQALSPA